MFLQGLYGSGIHGGNTLYGGEGGASGLNWWNPDFGPYSDNVTEQQLLNLLNGYPVNGAGNTPGGGVGPVGNPPDPFSGGQLPWWFWPVVIAIGALVVVKEL